LGTKLSTKLPQDGGAKDAMKLFGAEITVGESDKQDEDHDEDEGVGWDGTKKSSRGVT